MITPFPVPEEPEREGLERLRFTTEPARPQGAAYPLAQPDPRTRDPEFDRLVSDVMRVVGRRRFPRIDSDRDRIRLMVYLHRFLYSPQWPTWDDTHG